MTDCINVREDTEIGLYYPTADDPIHVEISLLHTRAASSVRVWFDLDENVWVIERAFDKLGEEWTPVAYLPAWTFPEEEG